MTFVISLRLGEPPSLAPVRERLDLYPSMRFKLDPTSSWTEELIAELVATGAVDSVDFKGHYHGSIVDQPPDPVLYERVVRAFPSAWIEDPALTEETDRILLEHRDRITWDAPIHSVADIEALPFPPQMVNIKPSRLGALAVAARRLRLLRARGIGAYGGGQFELGPGRGQIQYLASLFHPDTPNDVAPAGYHEHHPGPGLPVSPLAPPRRRPGFAGRRGMSRAWAFSPCRPVRFSDLDAMRHLNNVAFLQFFESARIAFISTVLPEHRPTEPDDFGLIFAECHISYRAPAFFDEKIRTRVRPDNFARSSLQVLRDEGATTACWPRATACWSATTTRPDGRCRCQPTSPRGLTA